MVSDLLHIAEIVCQPSIVIGDNINALKWASVDAITPGNKHVRIAYHWIKEHVRDDDVCLRDGPSATNLADFLTKKVEAAKMQKCMAGLNLHVRKGQSQLAAHCHCRRDLGTACE